MNKLWNAIEHYDFDVPVSEYTFSIRLAHENGWTEDFTRKAIIEYKKFMYLAATARSMVSPSEIVDRVWHQHLIFTNSYNEFSRMLGKRIEHIPSTHAAGDKARFEEARTLTKYLYEETFGKQPPEFWNNTEMHQSIPLTKARHSVLKVTLFGILLVPLIVCALYLILSSVYIHINNPWFLLGYLLIVIATGAGLYFYSLKKLKTVFQSWPKTSFVFNLNAAECLYLQTGSMLSVINATVNDYVIERKLLITKENKLKLNTRETHTSEDISIIESLKQEDLYYGHLVDHLKGKPVFCNVSNALESFEKPFQKSSDFVSLYIRNVTVLLFMFSLGVVRVVTGLLRHKHVEFLIIILIFLTIAMGVYLYRFRFLMQKNIIPNYYKEEVLPLIKPLNRKWKYFLLGSVVITAAFEPLIAIYQQKNNTPFSGGCGSSCGSSCGGGGGCGGCGGD